MLMSAQEAQRVFSCSARLSRASPFGLLFGHCSAYAPLLPEGRAAGLLGCSSAAGLLIGRGLVGGGASACVLGLHLPLGFVWAPPSRAGLGLAGGGAPLPLPAQGLGGSA